MKRETLQNVILNDIERGSKIYTDQANGYYNLAEKQFIHDTINHLQEYVRVKFTRTALRTSGVC